MNDHDKDNWPRADHKHDLILKLVTFIILIIMCAYAYARHLIGAPL